MHDELTPEERLLLQRSQDLAITRRRILFQAVASVGFAAIVLFCVLQRRPPKALLWVFVGYIAVTGWEKISYGCAVLRYKGLIQKITAGEGVQRS